MKLLDARLMVKDVVERLQDKDFAFGVQTQHQGEPDTLVDWDVFYSTWDGEPCTIALAVVEGQLLVPCFAKGQLDGAAVMERISAALQPDPSGAS